MSMQGDWVLQYCWQPATQYSQANMTFNNDHTFVSGSLKGQWRLLEGTLMLSFNTGPAKYGGNLDGPAALGAMSTFGGLNGCWIMSRQGSGIPAAAASAMKATHDLSGNRL